MAFLRTLVFALLVASTVTLLACNTIRGFGRDVEKGGESIQEGATQVQQEIKD